MSLQNLSLLGLIERALTQNRCLAILAYTNQENHDIIGGEFWINWHPLILQGPGFGGKLGPKDTWPKVFGGIKSPY